MEGLSPDGFGSLVRATLRPEQMGYLADKGAERAPAGNGTGERRDVEGVALEETDAYLTKLEEPRELWVLLNLSYSLQMLRRLPWYACDDLMPELPPVVRQASRDAMFTHARLVADFFWRMPSTDDNARLFLPSWTPSKDLAVRLEAHWQQAMTFVAPLRHDRQPSHIIEPHEVDLSALALERVVFDCDEAVEAFVDACGAAQVELLPEIRTLLDSGA